MKPLLFFLALMTLANQSSATDVLNQKNWIHGSEDCKANDDPAIDILRFSESTFILRQNKCLHFEAPFIYVLFGDDTVLVQDTGATAEADKFPLYDTLQGLINQRQETNNKKLNILVTHSHSHGDHIAADGQFRDKEGITLVEANAESVRRYFGFDDWPNGVSTLDLGDRELTIIPIPGHQEESIAIYDSQTNWLLTGDTFYPGRLYIKNWLTYKTSISRLVEFSKSHKIDAILGTHIEMSNTPGEDYPMGTTFQPDEAKLALGVQDLLLLESTLDKIGAKPKKQILPKFVIYPISRMQRILGGVLGWAKKLVD